MDTDKRNAENEAEAHYRGLPRLVDWRGACAAIGGDRPISRATLDRLTKAGALKVRRPAPGTVRWAIEDIAEYLNAVQFPRKAA